MAIEVFYADRRLETFGRCGAGWFWWCRRRGFPPGGLPTGPFATSYAAYHHAMNAAGPISVLMSATFRYPPGGYERG